MRKTAILFVIARVMEYGGYAAIAAGLISFIALLLMKSPASVLGLAGMLFGVALMFGCIAVERSAA